jgi:thiamine-monophosphate kinase
MNEFALIDKIKKKIPKNLQGPLGIGDDAGGLKAPKGHEIVWTVDAMVEGIDFLRVEKSKKRLGALSPEQAGRKALAINLSDLAAMGAKPLGCVVSLGIPPNMPEKWVLRFYDGLITFAKQYKTACVGGDITSAPKFFASVSLAGSAPAKSLVRRSGAKPGHGIAVTGALGGSLRGSHASFTPRIEEACFLAQSFKPSAMIDISDGLLQDLGHILESSKAGAEIEMGEIPISKDAARMANRNPMKAVERACTDGEDFELLFTVPASNKQKLTKVWQRKFPEVPLSWIGRVEKQKGVRWTFKGRKIRAPQFKRLGFQHFR